jgi:hypothetical protein
MRTDAAAHIALALARCLLVAAPLAAAASSSHAAGGDDALAIQIADPGLLAVGQPASVEVSVSAAHGDELPLLLTPTKEGQAIAVVRGRLLRSDARSTQDGVMRFTIPVMPRGAGAAILRIQVVTYRCLRTCSPVRGTATRVLRAAHQ